MMVIENLFEKWVCELCEETDDVCKLNRTICKDNFTADIISLMESAMNPSLMFDILSDLEIDSDRDVINPNEGTPQKIYGKTECVMKIRSAILENINKLKGE